MRGTPYQTTGQFQLDNATLGRRWMVELPCSIETVGIGSKQLLKVSARWPDGSETVLWTTSGLANFGESHAQTKFSDFTFIFRGSPEDRNFSAIIFAGWFTPSYATQEEAMKH